MRAVVFGVAMVLAASAAILAQLHTAVVEEVRLVDRRWGDVYAACDADQMASMLADDLVFIHLNGGPDDKSGQLKAVKSCTAELQKTEPTNIRVYGNAAVVHGDMTYKGKGQPDVIRIVYARVWVKEHGRWVLVSHQSTPAPPPKKTS